MELDIQVQGNSMHKAAVFWNVGWWLVSLSETKT